MKKDESKTIILFQILTVITVLFCFFLISEFTHKLYSFIFGMIVYWIILFIQILYIGKPFTKGLEILKGLSSRKKRLISTINYIPPIMVFIVAFFPMLGSINIGILFLTAVIGFINGFLEELYWRGLIFEKEGFLISIVSLSLFTVNHSAFLFFSLEYQGGALNLIGGPFIMGAIWLYSAKQTKTIKHGIFAHQIVNAFAFYSMFIKNL